MRGGVVQAQIGHGYFYLFLCRFCEPKTYVILAFYTEIKDRKRQVTTKYKLWEFFNEFLSPNKAEIASMAVTRVAAQNSRKSRL